MLCFVRLTFVEAASSWFPTTCPDGPEPSELGCCLLVKTVSEDYKVVCILCHVLATDLAYQMLIKMKVE